MKISDLNILDVVKRDAGYALYYGGKPLKTPGAHEVAHGNVRLLEHLLREIALNGRLQWGGISAYSMFSVIRDSFGGEGDGLLEEFPRLLERDPVVRRKFGGGVVEENEENLDFLLDLMERHNQAMMFVFGGVSALIKTVNAFFAERSEGQAGKGLETFEDMLCFFRETYEELPAEERAGIGLLAKYHEAGLILPMLLIKGRITASEYANTLFSVHLPWIPKNGGFFSHKIFPDMPGDPLLPDWHKPARSFSQIREKALKLLEYISYGRFEGGGNGQLAELIATGESYTLEFKSTLRWNLHSGKKDASVSHACLKTIAAFLNSSGGTLLVGVRDDGTIEGIETDRFDNEDRFSLYFWSLVQEHMGESVSANISTRFEQRDGGTVFVVKCSASSRPVFIRQKGGGEEFFIRVGPRSVNLSIEKALTYIRHRFGDE